MKPVLICAYYRTPFTPAYKGALARVRPDEMAAQLVRGLVERTGIPPGDIEDLILGCAYPEAEQGFNLGRLVVLLAGLPISVAGMTLNRFCGSSMQSVHIAAGAIQMGAGEAFLCAGVESMSRIPMTGYNPMPHPELARTNPGAYMSMGETAENVVKRYGLTREEQDAFALESQRKAREAQEQQRFKDEIIPVQGPDGMVSDDGCLRPDTTLEALAGLQPAFDRQGSVTAGTSSPLTDGAAALLVCTEAFASANGLTPLARVRAVAVAGCQPDIMGIGPVPAVRKVLERAAIGVDELDVIELNEAFSSQSLAVIRDLNMDPAKVNLDGGAISLGHPLGASGARITGKSAQLLRRVGGRYALATQCIGGGQGIATVLERV